jgi:xylulokinase
VALYLGLDASTQSLTAVVIDVESECRRVVLEHTVNFDTALAAYGTRHGVLPGSDPLIATSPPLMWAEALDLTMAELSRSGLELRAVRAIAGSAQQHGSVYLARGAGDRLAVLDPRRPLGGQLRDLFSRAVSPIWMDSSTGRECAEITAAVGGPERLAALTGSRAFERFTAAQIRKFARDAPDAYARTERVHLVSSFMASLLAGRHAPVDPGDASGTNLMNIRTSDWAPEAVRATAAQLESRLPEISVPSGVVSPLSSYWRERYGFPAAGVVAWSGDNPSSLVGAGLVEEGRVAVSLGTSDTIFGFIREPRVDPSGIGHVFASPTGGYMGLTCFKNGSLARERVRDDYGLDWAQFADALRQTPAGNRGGLMLPWFEPEITPPIVTPGVRRLDLDPADAAANVRAVVEGQMMAMAHHSRWMGVEVHTMVATGGAAVNREILQVMADVFGAVVYQLPLRNSAALGAALRAFHAAEAAAGRTREWREVVAGLTEPVVSSAVQPRVPHRPTYDALMTRYAAWVAAASARS